MSEEELLDILKSCLVKYPFYAKPNPAKALAEYFAFFFPKELLGDDDVINLKVITSYLIGYFHAIRTYNYFSNIDFLYEKLKEKLTAEVAIEAMGILLTKTDRRSNRTFLLYQTIIKNCIFGQMKVIRNV